MERPNEYPFHEGAAELWPENPLPGPVRFPQLAVDLDGRFVFFFLRPSELQLHDQHASDGWRTGRRVLGWDAMSRTGISI